MTPTSSQVIGFRAKLIEAMQSFGHTVAVITFDDEYKQTIEERGIEINCVKDTNRGSNPFALLSLKNRYCSAIKQIHPDIVFTFMLKPNIFGVRAAKKAGVKKIFSMVEGVGDVFINNGIKWKLIRVFVCKMYRKSFKSADKVFFLNNDDKSEFIERKLVKPEQCEVIPGIGVDLEHFAYKPLKNHNTFLMIARMLKTKGVTEYCQAARLVKQKYPDAVFNYLGAEGTVKVADIQEYIDDGSINYLGTTTDVRPYLEESAAFVLPTYREGFPVSVMEAMAVGRMVIASNTNGCRDAVVNGESGILTPIKGVDALAQNMIRCIEHPQETEQMGINGRKFAEARFDQNAINEAIIKDVMV